MKHIEKFLNSFYYIAFIFIFTFISWTFFKETPPHYFNLYNMIGVLTLVVFLVFVLVSFENTLYAMPILIGFLFIINHPSLTFDSTTLIFPIISVALIIISFVVHIIRFKPVFRRGRFFLGFLLLAIAYLIPLLYTPFQFKALPVSLLGATYLGFYVFFTSTTKGNIDYLFKMMLIINLLLCFQMVVYIMNGYIQHPELTFYERLLVGWDRNLGWANVNDMCFYISLTAPSYVYFIFKKPKTYLIWFLMLIPILIIILSKSRGGVIGFGVAVIGLIYFSIYQGQKVQLKHGILFLSFLIIFFIVNRDVIILWWQYFNDTATGDLNEFSSNRLFLYREGWRIFLRNPLFGAGWLSIDEVAELWYLEYGAYQRLFMFHSTLFHTLATMGLFGLVGLIIHYTQIFKFIFQHLTLEKYLFVIGYIASQVHGLIDNVQFAVPYSILMVVFLSVFETSKVDTLFETVNNKYKLIH